MQTKLNIDTWNRKEHFQFFSQFEEPFFGITAEVDVTKAHSNSKSMGVSFFLFYLHKSLQAANQILPFRYRIEAEDIIIYDTIHASATINRNDATFGFSFMIFDHDFKKFQISGLSEIERIRSSNQLFPAINGNNVIHFSSLPWIKFTSLSHARQLYIKDSVPKISFGKCTSELNKMTMPVSVHAHHGLVDGKDIGDFFDLFQTLLNK